MRAIQLIFRFRSTLAALFVALLLVVPACAGDPTADSPAADSASLATGWLTSLESAQQEAKADDKKILVNLYASWCGWCRRLDQQVFSSARFGALSEDFVLLKIDVEKGTDGPMLQRRFRTSGVPVTLVLTHRLDRVAAISGFLPADKFVDRLEEAVSSYDGQQSDLATLQPGATQASRSR